MNRTADNDRFAGESDDGYPIRIVEAVIAAILEADTPADPAAWVPT